MVLTNSTSIMVSGLSTSHIGSSFFLPLAHFQLKDVLVFLTPFFIIFSDSDICFEFHPQFGFVMDHQSKKFFFTANLTKASIVRLSILLFTTICFYWRRYFNRCFASISWPFISKDRLQSCLFYSST